MKMKILLLVLIMAAGYPALRMQFDDYGHNETVLDQLKELQILDAETNGLMMRSRLDIDKNYDRLSTLPAKIKNIQNDISSKREHFLKANNASFVSNFQEYMEAEENKNAIVENFKSHNSVLRNSVRYAPLAADRLIQAATDNRFLAEAETLKKLKADLLEYSLTGRVTIKRRVVERSSEVLVLKEKLPPESAVLAASFFNHLDVILQEKEITDTYLEKAINGRTARFLSVTVDFLQSKIETERNSFSNKILFIYLGAFSLLLLYQVVAALRTSRKEPLAT